MRRIYDSDALHRDDDDPGAPNEHSDERPQSFRSIESGALSRLLVPARLRHWAVSVDVSTPRDEYPADGTVPFTVEMKNALPVPITITARSPVLWNWTVDGLPEASRIDPHDAPDEQAGFEFDRGERKTFRKRWDGRFRVAQREWEPAGPGEYAVGAALNVDDAEEKGLTAETTVRLV
jgi:hypothetical protein